MPLDMDTVTDRRMGSNAEALTTGISSRPAIIYFFATAGPKRGILNGTWELLGGACPTRPTNRSQVPHVQASARTQRMTRDKQ
jgi:hypothetical protein